MKNNTYNIMRRVFMVLIVMSIISSLSIVTFAAEPTSINGVFAQATAALNSIIKGITQIATGLTVLLTICGLILRMRANPQLAAQATKWLTTIWISYAGIVGLKIILGLINSIVGVDNGFLGSFLGQTEITTTP